MTVRDDPPDTPRCPHCTVNDRVTPATDEERRWGHKWFCEACGTYFKGSAVEYQNYRAKIAAQLAERGELDQSHRAGQNQGVLGEPS